MIVKLLLEGIGLGCVYGINEARGFGQGFLHIFVILSIMNLIDRVLIDGYWVGHTKMWIIPGTEDLIPAFYHPPWSEGWLFTISVIARIMMEYVDMKGKTLSKADAREIDM